MAQGLVHFTNSPFGLSGYFGGRIEGVPSHDAFGGSRGFRRPGYAVSVEPGISYGFNSMSVFFSLPIALYRNRVQSYDDLEKTRVNGVFTNGDAAFADYSHQSRIFMEIWWQRTCDVNFQNHHEPSHHLSHFRCRVFQSETCIYQ